MAANAEDVSATIARAKHPKIAFRWVGLLRVCRHGDGHLAVVCRCGDEGACSLCFYVIFESIK